MAETVYPRILGVSDLTYYLREYLAEDEFLSSVAVQGEVTGCRLHASGHLFFTLREGESGLRVVMFRRYSSQLRRIPQDGEQMVVVGSVSLFERDSVCQLYAEALFPAGEGAQKRLLDELKQKLAAEGLFAPERKKPLPAFALNIGVITAADSAAWADIQRIVHNRCPGAELKFYSALVQGVEAPASLAAALAKADLAGHDVLICGRGGGANEDLAAFDTEQVVRALAALRTPVISAVGHESDVSLADLAADVRAATPTHAATLAAPDAAALSIELAARQKQLRQALQDRLALAAQRLSRLLLSPVFSRPQTMLDPAQLRLDAATIALCQAAAAYQGKKEQALSLAAVRLAAQDPLAVLSRGYAVAERETGGVIYHAAEAEPGSRIRVRLADGKILARVEGTEEL